MKMRTMLLFVVLFLVAGCKTTEVQEVTPISWKQQQAYSAKVRDPRIFGLGIYDTPSGPQIRGGGRVHPGRAEALEMLMGEEETPRPVVNLNGNFGKQWPVLLDVSLASSWFEFDVAQDIGARPVGEGGKVELVRQSGDDVPACFSLIPFVNYLGVSCGLIKKNYYYFGTRYLTFLYSHYHCCFFFVFCLAHIFTYKFQHITHLVIVYVTMLLFCYYVCKFVYNNS